MAAILHQCVFNVQESKQSLVSFFIRMLTFFDICTVCANSEPQKVYLTSYFTFAEPAGPDDRV